MYSIPLEQYQWLIHNDQITSGREKQWNGGTAEWNGGIDACLQPETGNKQEIKQEIKLQLHRNYKLQWPNQ